jgi:hypothetical protein
MREALFAPNKRERERLENVTLAPSELDRCLENLI